jgi:hypothetical protein
MGSSKQAMLREMDKRYQRNQYTHQVAKLRKAIRLHADKPEFVAKLRKELELLQSKRR